MPRCLALLWLLCCPLAAAADEPPPAAVGATLSRLETELARAAPNDDARRLAGHHLTEARRVLLEAKELARLGRVDDARARLRLVELRVRLVSLSVDAARLERTARERERAALQLREEARVARAAFEQAYERRIELEHAPPPAPPAPNGAAAGSGEGSE